MGSLPTLSTLKGLHRELAANDEPILLHRILENTIKSLERNNNNEKIKAIHSIELTDTTAQDAALICGNNRMSFTEINEAANKIARGMLAKVRTSRKGRFANQDGDHIVAVSIQPSEALVITLLAVWKMGAAYLPLDITFPVSRTQHILNESEPILIVVESGDMRDYHGYNAVNFRDLQEASYNLSTENIPNADTLIDKADVGECLALVLYTSGSTGIPKGVRIPHSVVVNRLKWQWRTFPYSKAEKVCVFKTALTFVDSVSELWGPLIYGRSILILSKQDTKNPERLVDALEEHKVERIVLVPTLLRAILMYIGLRSGNKTAPKTNTMVSNKHLQHLTLWVCSGEVLSKSLAEMFYQYFDKSTHRLCNFYGSTEVMGDVTYHIVESPQQLEGADKVPIGKPVDNTVIYILDKNMQPVNAGEIGELFVSGGNLADGYVRMRDANKFVDNPMAVDPSQSKLYRTGDYAKIIKNTVYFEGRTDSQIKVRGHRVDLSEVEAAVSAVKQIDKSVVLVYRPGEVNQALLTFVTLLESITAIEIEDILKTTLAPYMIPQVIVLGSIPLLVNGKVDRQCLLKKYQEEYSEGIDLQGLDYSGIPSEQFDAAKALFETLASVLGASLRTHINAKCNFYQIGGNSLNSIYAITKLRDLGYFIAIGDFISAPTLKDVINRMMEENSTEAEAIKSSAITIKDAKYKVEILQNEQKDEAFSIVATSFFEKSDLEQWIVPPILIDDYYELMELVWKNIHGEKLSFVVKGEDGYIRGVALNLDFHNEPAIHLKASNGLNTVFEFLEVLEGPIRESSLPKGKGKIFHSLMMAGRTDLTPQEKIELFFFMEEEVIRVAKRLGFTGVFTSNTNALTQQLGADVNNYNIMVDYQVNRYVAPNGTKPFGCAPDSQRIMVSWKVLR